MTRMLSLILALWAGSLWAVSFESESELFMRRSGESFVQCPAGRHELSVGDTILLGKNQTLLLLGEDGSKYTVGEKSSIRLESVNQKAKTLQLLLVKGSVRVSAVQPGSVVRTFGLQVRCQPGLLDILADTGKSLVIPQRGQGAVAYSSHQVKKILLGQKALVDQKGIVTIQGKARQTK